MLRAIKQKLKRTTFAALTRVWGDDSRHVVLPTLTGPAKWLRFRLNLSEFIEPLYFYGNYEMAEVRAISKICQPGWVVWDCGIYLGYYTNLFCRLVGPSGIVVAFEPDPRNVARAKENLFLNKFTNVVFVEAAVGPPVGEIDFVFSQNTNSHIAGTYIGSDDGDYAKRERIDETVRLRCMSLDEAYADPNIPNPHLIKIDIEGAERLALEYMAQIATQLRPIIVVELHNPDCDAEAWRFFQSVNYSMASLDQGKQITSRTEVGGTLLCTPN